VHHIPNILILIRLGLIPLMAYYLAQRSYAIALSIFLVAALSDLADGYIARRFKRVSKIGAALDPIALPLNPLRRASMQRISAWWVHVNERHATRD